MNTLAERYAAVQERLTLAARRAGRPPEEITLVAVSKTWPAEIVLAAYEIGLRHFGENRVEELVEKRPQVEAQLGRQSGLVWHLIGTLQSRKTDEAAVCADAFHALDRPKIANRLSRALVANGRTLPIFLEVNVSGEETKAGLDCRLWEDAPTQRVSLLSLAETAQLLPGLQLYGLMTMAPWDVAAEEIRTVFRRTRRLAEWLQTALARAEPLALSMGMTDDFEIAIEEGATHVRIGRALFGPRQ
ncbi:MAG: YggS family pyridoxal phosphate-dependent enzyme [Chloroflexota bacterium]